VPACCCWAAGISWWKQSKFHWKWTKISKLSPA
jgi:hypothetical protein